MTPHHTHRPTEEDLRLLTEVLRAVATRALTADDTRDFCQSVHLRLLETDYALFRKFRGQSSLRTFLTVAVTRLLQDWRNQARGKWRPRAAVVRMGDTALRLDQLINRDGLTISEAIEMVMHGGCAESRAQLQHVVERLPPRARRRFVADQHLIEAPDPRCEDPVLLQERRRAARRQALALRRAVRALPGQDRRLLAARFGAYGRMSAFARATGTDVKALYRRCDRMVQDLRTALAPLRLT